MPRTPSLTRPQAEAIIGSADGLIVTSANRSILRKWVTASNLMSSADAYKLSNVQLANLYHEHGPRGTVAAPVSQPAVTAVAQHIAPVQDEAAKALQTLISALSKGMVVDAAAVQAIVSPMIADAIAAIELPEARTILEVRGPQGVKIVDGKVHKALPTVIKLASINHDQMLVGPTAAGKTTIGKQVATALGFEFRITSTVFDTHELLGFVDGMGNYHSTAFRDAFQNGGVWVADEIDAWDTSALLAANSALANGYATFPDQTTPVPRHPNFRVIATANTYGHGADRIYVGRNELDAASLDRFAVVAMDYDADLEFDFANGNLEWLSRVLSVRNQCRDKSIRHVVSSRAIIKGVAALAAGIDFADVEEIHLFKGMSKADRAKIA